MAELLCCTDNNAANNRVPKRKGQRRRSCPRPPPPPLRKNKGSQRNSVDRTKSRPGHHEGLRLIRSPFPAVRWQDVRASARSKNKRQWVYPEPGRQ